MAKLRDKKVIFLHLPKAGGSTLIAIMHRQYGKESVHAITNRYPEQSLIAFGRLGDADKQGMMALEGHIPYSATPYLPGNTSYITLLREPIKRVTSFYYHVRSRSRNYLHETIVSNNLSLEECLRSGISNEFDNLQTRMLSGEQAYNLGYGQCTQETLQVAIENIKKHFALAGVLNRFDETVLLLKKKLGWNIPFYEVRNQGRFKPELREVSPEALDLIKAHNQLDIELYAFASKLFDEQVKAQGPSFNRELKAFKILNYFASRSLTVSRKVAEWKVSRQRR